MFVREGTLKMTEFTPRHRQGTFQLARVDDRAAVQVDNFITNSVKTVFVFSCCVQECFKSADGALSARMQLNLNGPWEPPL